MKKILVALLIALPALAETKVRNEIIQGAWINVQDSGAVCDGTTDNATAFTAAAAKANASSGRIVYFPDCIGTNTYKYSGGLVFTKPVTLFGSQAAVLNYTGSSFAVKMGPDGLVIGTAHTNPYIVQGLTFTGGASSTQGIYFNTFIVNPAVIGTNFIDFGSPTGYSIFGQSQNWDFRVKDLHWWATVSTACRNMIRANGIATDGVTSDNGQTRLIASNIQAGNQSTCSTQQVGIYWNGATSQMLHVSVAGFSPNLWIGSNAGSSSAFSQLNHVYMEIVQGAGVCLRYGESAGAYTAFFTANLSIANTYCNVHNADFGTTAHFMGPASGTNGLQNLALYHNFVANLTALQPLVVQNNIVSQTGNRSDDTRQSTNSTFPGVGPNPLHTAGGNISAWNGSDGEYAVFANSSDAANVLAVRAGKTTQQFGTLQIEDFAGTLLGAYQCSGAGIGNSCTLYGPGTVVGAAVPSTGGLTIKTVLQANLGTPANGTILYCSDCNTATACTAGGTGALASRQNGAWKCL